MTLNDLMWMSKKDLFGKDGPRTQGEHEIWATIIGWRIGFFGKLGAFILIAACLVKFLFM